MKKILVTAIFFALLFPVNLDARFNGPPKLNEVASSFSSRKVVVKCANEEEDSTFATAWGYTILPSASTNEINLYDALCLGALAIEKDIPEIVDYHKALGTMVLVHEAYHLKEIKGNGNEARTECRAMRHYDIALTKLGASQEVMNRLMPIMLIFHWRIRARTEHWHHEKSLSSIFYGPFPTYHHPSCEMPLRYNRYIGNPPS